MRLQDKAYESLLVITVGLVVLHLWLGHEALLYASVAVGGLGLVSARLRWWIVYLWGQLALGLGYVNSRVLLTVVFYMMLVPIALLRRWMTRQSSKTEKPSSYFQERTHVYSAKDFINPW
ncbi:hypothetical protein BFP72_12855 [Reichenbachiella sp. 5M10]|uniref:SxtJ family membrane protein n=1 Tax=Reichenbachiella sp. 5M10 TaxID=1889772 RepID=UPI000C15EBF8|nr:SxtJ family membrane protein [Reichenbachiella sp. 5M10]PIB36216.1 hypothetical protein BFP72_12855 [Reichenbachiella sp. 5M10]